jgi:DNA-binding transcriptional ArsR family regulator
MKENQPMETFMIQDLETLRLLADPLRTQIIEILVQEPLTVRQVADRLGLTPGKLYYHVNLLEKHGLLVVVETRMVSNMLEKVYRSVSDDFDVEPSLLSFTTDQGKESLRSIFAGTLDATREDLARSLEARAFNLEHRGAQQQPRKVILNRDIARLTEEQAEKFADRLEQLIKEFGSQDQAGKPGAEDLQTFALAVAYYPSYFYQEEETD